MNLSIEEKHAIIKRLCRGYSDDLAVRCDVLGTNEWRLSTPIVRDRVKHRNRVAIDPKTTRSARHSRENDRKSSRFSEPIAGVGDGPGEAIEDCWAQLTAGPIALLMEGSPPRLLCWDGTDFRDA